MRVAECCSVLQRAAVCCSMMQCVETGCRVLQNVAAYCSVLQHVSTLQRVAACCSMSQHARPTQSIMYVPLQVNIFQESILVIVQYKYLISCSGGELGNVIFFLGVISCIEFVSTLFVGRGPRDPTRVPFNEQMGGTQSTAESWQDYYCCGKNAGLEEAPVLQLYPGSLF